MYKTGLTADQLPTSTRNLKFTFTVTYMQAENNATPKEPVSFAADSWDTIAYYNNSNIICNTCYYFSCIGKILFCF